MQIKSGKYFILFFILIGTYFLEAQYPTRFQSEVAKLTSSDGDVNMEKVILFTGSSSVRFWSSIVLDFPEYNVLNRGFGGSQMSDLLFYYDLLISPYNPLKIFIYEGDNDLAAGKTYQTILNDTKALVGKIKVDFPETQIFLISPKPSVARWDLKDKYVQLNYKLGLWAMVTSRVTFIDIWTPMCDESGVVRPDLFISDQLHMNEKGYLIWKKTIGPYLDDSK